MCFLAGRQHHIREYWILLCEDTHSNALYSLPYQQQANNIATYVDDNGADEDMSLEGSARSAELRTSAKSRAFHHQTKKTTTYHPSYHPSLSA